MDNKDFEVEIYATRETDSDESYSMFYTNLEDLDGESGITVAVYVLKSIKKLKVIPTKRKLI